MTIEPMIPSRIENELELMGVLMFNPSAASCKAVQAIIGPEHFSEPMMARLFHLIGEGVKDGLDGIKLMQGVRMALLPDAPHLAEIGLTPASLIGACVRRAGPAIALEGAARQIKLDHLVVLLEKATEDGDFVAVQELGAEMEGLRRAHMTDSGDMEAVGRIVDRVLTEMNTAYQTETPVKDYAFSGISSLSRWIGGWRRKRFYVIAGRPSMGKAQPLDAKVRTTAGWKPMGEIRIGERLKSIDGKQSFVSGIFPQGEKEVFQVTFSDGRTTRCCGEHLWLVHCRHWPDPKTLSTDQVSELLAKRRYQGRLWIDHAPASSWGGNVETSLPIDPYVLGALVGDGGLSQSHVRLTSASQELLDEFEQRLNGDDLRKVSGAKYGYSVSRATRLLENNTLVGLKALGLFGKRSWEKFIPRAYLDARPYQRLQLLRGLLDTDGWIEKHNSVQFSTASVQLAQDVQEVARSLGAWCAIRQKTPTYRHRGEKKVGRTAWVLTISHPDPASLFFVSHKSSVAHGRSRRKMPVFRSIVRDGVDVCQCITVTHPSHLYFTDDYIVTHNSTLALSALLRTAIKGHGVVLFALEMGKDEVSEIALCDLAWSAHRRIEYKDITATAVHKEGFEEKYADILQVQPLLNSLPFYMTEKGGLSVPDIRSQALHYKQRLEAEGKRLDVICVDHLGLLKSSGKYRGNKVAETEEISASLKELAKELNCAVIAVAQLSRQTEGRDDKRPTLADLRWSGGIEQDADCVMMVYREEYYLSKQEPDGDKELKRQTKLRECKNTMQVFIEKQRGGARGELKLFCDIGCGVVRDLVRDHG